MKPFKISFALMMIALPSSVLANTLYIGFPPEEAEQYCSDIFWSADRDSSGVLENDEMADIGQFSGFYITDLDGNPVPFGHIAADTDQSNSIDGSEWQAYCAAAIYITSS